MKSSHLFFASAITCSFVYFQSDTVVWKCKSMFFINCNYVLIFITHRPKGHFHPRVHPKSTSYGAPSLDSLSQFTLP
ncbi:MAG: hypothetical protein Q8S84_02665 [bacterium]|nr:hypothetical protein [bacterium]